MFLPVSSFSRMSIKVLFKEPSRMYHPRQTSALALLRAPIAQQLTWCHSQGVPYKPDILIVTWSDSPAENELTLCRVSRILLLLISGGRGTSLYGLYRDVPLDKALGTLRSNDADGNENLKKTIGLISKTTTLHVHHAFLYISLPDFARLRREHA